MKYIVILTLAFLAVGCKQKVEEPSVVEDLTEEVVEVEPKQIGTVYRIDGDRPGIASEWILVGFDKETNFTGLWYWNSNDEKRIYMKPVGKEEHYEDLSAMTGQVQHPDGTIYGYALVEGDFRFYGLEGTPEEDFFQEYYYEDSINE